MKPDVSYWMGQGKVSAASRIANGPINGGFVYMGDVEALQISNNQTFDDIMENTSGNRNVAAHIPTGNTMSSRLTARQWTKDNVAKAAYASLSVTGQPAGTVTGELVSAYGGTLAPLANPGVSTVVAILGGGAAKVASVAVTVAGTGGTPGAVLPVTFTGGTPTTPATANAVINAAGGIDHIEMTNYGAGYASAPTATVTGITAPTLVVNLGGGSLVANTDYTLNAIHGSLTFLPGSTKVPPNSVPLTGNGLATPISINYAFDTMQGRIEAMTTGIKEYALRFEGLNTANDNAPVIITVWRMPLNLARVFDLIQARSGSLELDGMVLPASDRDPLLGQSQYWTMVKV